MKKNLTISEALGWKTTLQARHNELVALRNENANKRTRYYGANADKEEQIVPLYDVKKLDKLITQVAREIRSLDEAIKHTNATQLVLEYQKDDAVLGEVE